MLAAPRFPTSLIAATALLAALGSCTAPLPLENRSCPCAVAAGYICCLPDANLCIPAGQTCPTIGATADKLTVCQGGRVSVTVTGPNLANATGFAVEGYPITLRPGATTTQVQLDVDIPHGAALGAKDLTFATAGTQQLPAVFTVTAITVGPDGHDTNDGSRDRPYRTYHRAATVAGKGDTILLLDSTTQYSFLTGETASPVLLADGITVRGQSWMGTVLLAPLLFSGDGVVKDLRFGARAHLYGPNSTVVFDNVKGTATYSGISVDETATGSTITITGRDTEVNSIDAALAVNASNVQVNIRDGATLTNIGGDREAILLKGAGVSVQVQDGHLDSPAINALVDEGGGTYDFQRATVNGILSFAHPDTTATISNVSFKTSQQAGRSGIVFKGRTLRVADSQFFVMGILQDNPNSTVVVRDSLFNGYRDVAYTLAAGQLDLGTKDQPGNNRFGAADNAMGQAGLRIRALAGAASVTSSATSFDGIVPPASVVMGPASRLPWYEILDRVSLTFF